MCNIMIQTSIELDDCSIEDMNQKLNYYKALQIAASLSEPKVFLNKEEIIKP
uniref:ORF18 n=1 Tax=Nitrosopumilaceae spindle-shaped virus TaxID=3065433 RepID=A0AAT9J9U5_9VIRU